MYWNCCIMHTWIYTTDSNSFNFNFSSKLVSLESHRKFDESCLINDSLPTYTNIYIYLFVEIMRHSEAKEFKLLLLAYFLKLMAFSPQMTAIYRQSFFHPSYHWRYDRFQIVWINTTDHVLYIHFYFFGVLGVKLTLQFPP